MAWERKEPEAGRPVEREGRKDEDLARRGQAQGSVD